MKKSDIDKILKEFIDNEMNTIGQDTVPQDSPNLDSRSGSKPTDYHRRVGHQHYTDDYLGHVGMLTFYESEGDDNKPTELADKFAREVYMFDNGESDNFTAWDEVAEEIKSKYYSIANRLSDIAINTLTPSEPALSESEIKKVMEDKLTSKKDTSIGKKKDSDVLPDSVKKISDLIMNLAKKDRDLLMKSIKK